MRLNNLLNNFIIFTAGAAIGSVVTWKLVEKKYAAIAQEEIESVKESYRLRKSRDCGDTESVSDECPDEYFEKEQSEYNQIADNEGYSTYQSEEVVSQKDYDEEEEEDMDRPYVISPDEFGELDYAQISLTYHTDGIVSNDRKKIVENVDELIGLESLEHFGEYEEDSVFVRNDKLKIDFEILKDYLAYSEID